MTEDTRTVYTKVGFQTFVNTMEEAMVFVAEKVNVLEEAGNMPYVEIKPCHHHDPDTEQCSDMFEVTIEGTNNHEEPKVKNPPWG